MKNSILRIMITIIIVLLVPILLHMLLGAINNSTNSTIGKNESDNSFWSYFDENPESFSVFEKDTIVATFVLFSIALFMRIKRIVFVPKGEYERNTECVIDPISAEAIIDGKIDAKDLIMTCITSAVHKKNLEYSDEDVSIKLLDTKDLTYEERQIIYLLYGYCCEGYTPRLEDYIETTISFSQLKEMFAKDNESTLYFNDGLKKVKESIKDNLFKHHIISKTCDKILYFSRILAIVFAINSLFVIGIPKIIGFIEVYSYLLILLIEVGCVWSMISIGAKHLVTNTSSGLNSLALYVITMIFILVAVLLHSSYFQIVESLALFLINLLTISLSSTLVYTKTGKVELEKAIKLKRYMLDYSLMKERDVNDAIIWDEYLVYATAFGIPCKITSKIAESLMNLNISLQVFNSIFSLV